MRPGLTDVWNMTPVMYILTVSRPGVKVSLPPWLVWLVAVGSCG
jgi:hypothetical protein